jgi:hypothetical protein
MGLIIVSPYSAAARDERHREALFAPRNDDTSGAS